MKKFRIISMALATLAATLLAAQPAAASVASGVVGGAGWGTAAVRDDWTDEGPLDSSSSRHSRATGLWQQVLQAEGLYSGRIDCDYGPATTAATRDFQARYGLTQDGSAGPQTMGFAGGFLWDDGNNRDIGYSGTEGNPTFRRINGVYHAFINGAWRSASYTSASGC